MAEGRIPAVNLIMPAEEIPVSAYASRLLNRVEVAEATMAFHSEKPAGFDFKPGQFSERLNAVSRMRVANLSWSSNGALAMEIMH
jgi:hypothetical protein